MVTFLPETDRIVVDYPDQQVMAAVFQDFRFHQAVVEKNPGTRRDLMQVGIVRKNLMRILFVSATCPKKNPS